MNNVPGMLASSRESVVSPSFSQPTSSSPVGETREPSPIFEIFKDVNKLKLSAKSNEDLSIKDLKEFIVANLDTAPDSIKKIRVIFAGKELKNDESITKLENAKDETLHIIFLG